MKYRSYNRELRHNTSLIMDVLNSIQIDRRDNQNNIQQLINVTCVYGNRDRVLKSLENRDKTLKLPLVAITMGNISRDSTRVCDPHAGLQYQSREWLFNAKYNTPVPVNIEYSMSIITKFQEDLDQIICNFIPFSNPDFYVVWPNPKYPTENMKSQIVWDSNIGITYPNEVGEKDPYRLTAETNFVFKSWIFPGLDPIGSNDDGPLIHRINFCPNLIPIGDAGYMMDKFYEVPYCMPFSSFMQNVVCGYIDSSAYDALPLSANVSGYFNDISGYVTDDLSGLVARGLSGNPNYYISQEGNMYLITNMVGLTEGMKDLDLWNLYLDSLSGDLSGCLSNYVHYTPLP